MEQNNLMMELSSRFPEHKAQIARLLEENNDFREIAEDYQFCRIKLARLTAHPAENKPLIHHYENTMNELKEDMKEYFLYEH